MPSPMDDLDAVVKAVDIPVQAEIRVSSGDIELITGVPVPGKPNEMLASAPTALGKPVPNDGVVQMIGGHGLSILDPIVRFRALFSAPVAARRKITMGG